MTKFILILLLNSPLSGVPQVVRFAEFDTYQDCRTKQVEMEGIPFFDKFGTVGCIKETHS